MEVVLGEEAGVAGEEAAAAAGVEEAGVLVEDEVVLEDTETRVLLLKLWKFQHFSMPVREKR